MASSFKIGIPFTGSDEVRSSIAPKLCEFIGIPFTGSDEVRSSIAPKLCEPCFSDCKEVTAVVYCLDCDEKFCVACGNIHKKYKFSKGHKLCDLEEAPPTDVVQLMQELTTCPNHLSEEVVYICVDEDQLCCNQCANTKHRQCRQLETIDQCLKDGLVKNGAFTHEQKQQKSHQYYNRATIEDQRSPAHYMFREEKERAQAQNWNAVRRQQMGYGTELVHSPSWGKLYQPEVTIDQDLIDLGAPYALEVNVEPENVQTEIREDINTFSKRLCERSIELHEELEKITKHEVKHKILVSGTPERVQEYLQVVHAKLESAFNTLQTNLMSQCRTQTNDLLTRIQRQQTSAIDLQKQIKSNQEKMTSIQKHGQKKHVFLLSRRINEDLSSIENSTKTLDNNKTFSALKVVEKCSVNEIADNIVKALLIQKDTVRSPFTLLKQKKKKR